jgi:dTMP kinase
MRRRFISFEGSEGCGKTTQLALLKAALEKRGERVVLVREPGGTPIGEMIRHLLKHALEGRGMAPETELLLFAASRAELVRKVVLPALDEGDWVLSDRFSDSTAVYQGVARGLSPEQIVRVDGFATAGLEPGLTVLLDLSAEEAARRLASRPQAPSERFDRIEKEDASFFDRVRDGFRRRAAAHPERIKTVASEGTAEEVAAQVWEKVADAFQL